MKLIRNALIDPDLPLQDILFDECIYALQAHIDITGVDGGITESYDAEGNLLVPGGIDPHVHFSEPGFEDRENFLTGTASAAAGGITTIIDMPCTSLPPVTDVESLQNKMKAVSGKAYIDYAFWVGVRDSGPDYSANIKELWDEGVAGFKIYTISGMDTFKALPYEKIAAVLEEYPDILFAFHAEDQDVIEKALNLISVKELADYNSYVKCRPVEAEYTAVSRILDFLKSESRCHFVHISSKKAAERIIKAKRRIKGLSLETCPHYLEFICDDYADLRGRLKTAPPVKFDEDRAFLRASLKHNDIDFLASDHAGCIYESEKQFDDFSKIYNGIPGTQLLIPYLVSEFLSKGKISVKSFVDVTSANAAKRYGLFPVKGSLKVGSDADFTLISLTEDTFIAEKNLHSKGKYSPFNGMKFNGRIIKTIVRGQTVFENGNLLDRKPSGKMIRCIHNNR